MHGVWGGTGEGPPVGHGQGRSVIWYKWGKNQEIGLTQAKAPPWTEVRGGAGR